MVKYNLWSSVVPKTPDQLDKPQNDSTLEYIVSWVTEAECKWWIKLVEVDNLPCYQLIFHTPIPVTRRFVIEDLGWGTHFYPLDVEVSSYDTLYALLNGPSSYYIWTNDDEVETNPFANDINAPPDGTVHIVYSPNPMITKYIESQLKINKVYIIRLQPNENPIPLLKSIQHLALSTIIIVTHNFPLPNNISYPDSKLWKVNKYNNKIIEAPLQ